MVQPVFLVHGNDQHFDSHLGARLPQVKAFPPRAGYRRREGKGREGEADSYEASDGKARLEDRDRVMLMLIPRVLLCGH